MFARCTHIILLLLLLLSCTAPTRLLRLVETRAILYCIYFFLRKRNYIRLRLREHTEPSEFRAIEIKNVRFRM